VIRKQITLIDDFSGGEDTKTPIISMPLNKSPNMRNWHCAGLGNRLIKRGGFAKINSSTVESDGLDVFYPPGYQTYNYPLRDTAANTEISQGFKPATTGSVTKVKLWLKKVGAPAGANHDIALEIHPNSSGVPSGTPVTNGTATAIDTDDLATTYAWITFTFATNPSLTAGTQYHLVLTGRFTISAVNYVHWGVDDYDVVYPDGSMSLEDGTTWVTDPNYDACFEVYISGGAGGNDGTALWDFSSKNMMLGIWGTTLYKMDKSSTGAPDGTWDSVSGGSVWDTYTKLMLHCDGANTSTTFTDEIGKTMTAAGGAQLSTAQQKFGTASGLFDGTGDYLSTPDHADWYFGTGDFTIDFWVRFDTLPATTTWQVIVSQYANAANFWRIYLYNTAGTYSWRFGNRVGGSDTIEIFKDSSGLVVNTWYHIAFARNGNNFYWFQGGVQQGTTATDADPIDDNAGLLYIGTDTTAANFFNGWLDEIRISKGIARWTANFTPPAAAYSAGALSLTSSRFWTFGDWQSGRALLNTDIGLYTYVGTGDASEVAAAPLGKFVTIWKKYVFLAGIRGSPNQIRYCTLSTYGTWPAGNTLNFDTNDGDVITGIRTLKGKLYVFKRYSAHRVSYLGSNPTFQVDQILGLGCPSHFCIKEVDMGGEVGSVLIFPTTDKKLAIFDGYNVQIVHDTTTEESNDLFAAADDQPITFADMDYTYIDKFHAVVKSDSFEYILYCVLNGDTTVKYGFVFDYKTGGIYPYDGQIFSSSLYMMSTSKARILYTAGYTGYMWGMESGNDDDGTAINAYWVSGKAKPKAIGLLNRLLLLGINHKEVTSASTINMNVKYRLDWNVSWLGSTNFNYDHNDEFAFGKTSMFDIGTIENMFQVKITENSKNPAPTIYSLELHGKELGVDLGDRATA